MSTETIAPMMSEGSMNISFPPGVDAVDESVDSPDGVLVHTSNEAQASVHGYRFANPSGNPSGTQKFRVRVEPSPGRTGNGDPTTQIIVHQIANVGGSSQEIASGPVVDVTGGSQVIEFEWDASALLTASGERVGIRLLNTPNGGSPKKRACVSLDAVEWVANI